MINNPYSNKNVQKWINHSGDAFFLISMYILSTIMAVYYIIKCRLPLSWDQSAYLNVCAQIGHALSRNDWSKAFKIFVLHDQWSNRPGLHMLVGGIYAAIGHFNINIIVILSNMTWVALIFYLIYKLSEHLKQGSGVLSVFLFSCSYGLLFLYRDFLSELALTAGVLLVQYGYVMTNHLESRRWSLLTALFMIIGALTKESFVLYVFPIFIYSIFDFIIYKKYKNYDYCINWLMVFVFSSCVIAGFYLPIIHQLLGNMFDNVGSKVGQFFSRPYTKDNFHYYTVYLYFLSDLTFIPCVFISIATVLFYLLTGQITKLDLKQVGILLLLCIMFPVFVLTVFVTDTDVRFIFPLLPVVLIFCSTTIKTYSGGVQWAVISLFGIASIINITSSFVPIPWLPYMIHVGEFTIYRQHYNESGSRGIDKIQSNVTGAIEDIFLYLRTHQLTAKSIGILPSLAYMNNNIMDSYAALYEEPQHFVRIMRPQDLTNVDYVITTDKVFTAAPWETSSLLQPTFAMVMSKLYSGEYKEVYSKNITMDDNTLYFFAKETPP